MIAAQHGLAVLLSIVGAFTFIVGGTAVICLVDWWQRR